MDRKVKTEDELLGKLEKIQYGDLDLMDILKYPHMVPKTYLKQTTKFVEQK